MTNCVLTNRYELLTPNAIPKGFMDGRKACEKMVRCRCCFSIISLSCHQFFVLVFGASLRGSLSINTGNRIEWTPIRSVIIRVIMISQESDLLITSMITDQHRTTLNHKDYNFQEAREI